LLITFPGIINFISTTEQKRGTVPGRVSGPHNLYKQHNKSVEHYQEVCQDPTICTAASTPGCLSADYSKLEQRDRNGLGGTGSLSEFLSMLDRVLIRMSVRLLNVLLDFSWDPPLVELQNIPETET
jgi:hypothetical protein